jgi:putative ABC transport system substrate-binding protein
MKRREFVTLIGGAAVAWPLAVRAQQPGLPVVGFLHSTSAGPNARAVSAFREGLKQVGYVDGQNVAPIGRVGSARPPDILRTGLS